MTHHKSRSKIIKLNLELYVCAKVNLANHSSSQKYPYILLPDNLVPLKLQVINIFKSNVCIYDYPVFVSQSWVLETTKISKWAIKNQSLKNRILIVGGLRFISIKAKSIQEELQAIKATKQHKVLHALWLQLYPKFLMKNYCVRIGICERGGYFIFYIVTKLLNIFSNMFLLYSIVRRNWRNQSVLECHIPKNKVYHDIMVPFHKWLHPSAPSWKNDCIS